MDADAVLRGGVLVDGTGGPPRPVDIAVAGGLVSVIAPPGSLTETPAVVELDATGRAIAPGFIDAHAHSDLAMFLPDRWRDVTLAPLRQGVTTEVCGNCGESPFPSTPLHRSAVDDYTLAGFQVGLGGFDSLDSYAEHLAGADLPTNQAPLLGHGMLRGAAMGFDDRAPTDDELALMLRLAEEAFDQGAFGLSTGLIYPPGVYAHADEIARIAGVAARFDAPYVSHMRDEADRVDASIREALQVGRLSGAGIQISHHKLAGRPNWGRSSQTLAMLDAARTGGQDVTVDVYPYTAGSTGLHSLLPPWVNAGGLAAMLERIAEPAVRARIDTDFVAGLPGWQNLAGPAGWENLVIAGSPSDTSLESRSVAEIAAGAGRSPVDVICDIVAADRGHTVVVLHMMSDDDVQAIRHWDGAMLGSDGVPLPGRPHPRLAGTFTKALRAPAGTDAWAGLADRVHRMTAMPAQRYRIPGGRGTVTVGSVADLVVFDPVSVADRATYSDPLLPPVGVDHVLVGGVHSVAKGQPTGRYAGRVLRAR
ncbi:N-acyl-D-amino-acid deacylase family protein [Nakamurella lactea]|uniref:N-acyl-D-amino-acid deacylase family protein n=1 Tax=Nakamurella lactea TaxID=459515 RepID=UPI00040E4CFA|nr:amidohydrolase family protein [Nakamurella lactea]